MIILFATGSLLIVTVLGLLWDALNRRSLTASADDNAVPTDEGEVGLIGPARLAATMVSHCSRGPRATTLGLTVIALSGLSVLAAVLPYSSMQTSVEQGDIWAPLKMLGVAVPVYATPNVWR